MLHVPILNMNFTDILSLRNSRSVETHRWRTIMFWFRQHLSYIELSNTTYISFTYLHREVFAVESVLVCGWMEESGSLNSNSRWVMLPSWSLAISNQLYPHSEVEADFPEVLERLSKKCASCSARKNDRAQPRSNSSSIRLNTQVSIWQSFTITSISWRLRSCVWHTWWVSESQFLGILLAHC